MSIEFILALIGIAALIAYWNHHGKIATKAIGIAKHTTEEQGVQLLDQGLVLTKVGVHFSRPFGIRVKRTFRFEFSSRGDYRYLGWVIMTGSKLQSVTLQPFSENGLH